MGWLLQTTGSYTVGMWMCTGVPLVAAAVHGGAGRALPRART